MNCTRQLANSIRARGIVLLLVATSAAAITASIDTAHASADRFEAEVTEAQPIPPQQDGGELDGESELPWLFAVFAITWAAFFAYVFVMGRRQRELQREIDALKRAMDERERERPQAERGAQPREP